MDRRNHVAQTNPHHLQLGRIGLSVDINCQLNFSTMLAPPPSLPMIPPHHPASSGTIHPPSRAANTAPPPPTFIIILVFKIKRHFDGSIECFEARLVAKSYTQVEGLNFSWDLHSRGRIGYGWVSSHSGRYSWLRVAPVRCAKCILAPRSQGGSIYASPAWIQVIPNGQSLPPSQILLQSPSSLP